MLKAKTGVSVISIHGSEEELGKDLNDEIMSEGRGSEASLRPSLRPPVSGDRRGLQSRWILACHNPDESKSCEFDSKKEDSNTSNKSVSWKDDELSQPLRWKHLWKTVWKQKQKKDLRERQEQKQLKLGKQKVTKEKKKRLEGKEEPQVKKRLEEKEELQVEKESPDRCLTEEQRQWLHGSSLQEPRKSRRSKPSDTQPLLPPRTPLGWQEVGELQILPKKGGDEGAIPAVPSCATLSSASSPMSNLCAPCGLLQRRVRAGSERPCSRNRARSQDKVQQSQHDADTAEVRRGLSLR